MCHRTRKSGKERIHLPQIRKTGGGNPPGFGGSLNFWKELEKCCFFKSLYFFARFVVIKPLLPAINTCCTKPRLAERQVINTGASRRLHGFSNRLLHYTKTMGALTKANTERTR